MNTSALVIHNLLKQPDFPYFECWQAMREFTLTRQSNTADEIWLLQHQPVYTLGKAGLLQHLQTNPQNIPVIRSDRGGQITYHGPGQWMIYTMLDLKRLNIGVKTLVQTLEQVLINLCADYGIDAHRRPKAPGIYYRQQKLAAIGLRLRQSRCYHGLACNMSLDLTPFASIHPCGYTDLKAVSWQTICQQNNQPTHFDDNWMTQWQQKLRKHLQQAFLYQSISTTIDVPETLAQKLTTSSYQPTYINQD